MIFALQLEFEPRAEQAVLQRARCLLAIGDDGAAYRELRNWPSQNPKHWSPGGRCRH